MRIAIRGGHNFSATGARGIIDETTEDRKVLTSAISYLQSAGHEVLDVTPGNVDVNTDLTYGVNKANSWNADLFVSIHFNKAYEKYNGAIGTEAWIYGTGGNAEPVAHRIVNNIASKTGLINRGVKVSTALYELRKTNMAAVIVEVCFVEATEDVAIYINKGHDFFGKCIAEAINNNSINNPVTPTPARDNNNGGEEMRTYKNGSTPEPVYQTSTFSKEIGSLDAYEVAKAIDIDGNTIVYYNTSNGKSDRSHVVL